MPYLINDGPTTINLSFYKSYSTIQLPPKKLVPIPEDHMDEESVRYYKGLRPYLPVRYLEEADVAPVENLAGSPQAIVESSKKVEEPQVLIENPVAALKAKVDELVLTARDKDSLAELLSGNSDQSSVDSASQQVDELAEVAPEVPSATESTISLDELVKLPREEQVRLIKEGKMSYADLENLLADDGRYYRTVVKAAREYLAERQA